MKRGIMLAMPPQITPAARWACHTVGAGELLSLLGFVHGRNGEVRDCPVPGSFEPLSCDPHRNKTGTNRPEEAETEMLTDISKAQHVLVFSSDPGILTRLHQQFGNNGTVIDKAESVSAASRLMSSGSHDLAIVSLRSSEDCTLVKLAVSKDIPVVVMAAYQTSPAAMIEAARLGARASLLMRLFSQGDSFDECLVTMHSSLNSDWIHRI